MVYLSSKISMITLDVNGLNKPIERQRLVEQLKMHDPSTCYLQNIEFKINNIGGLKVKKRKKIYCANVKEKWFI